jgi:signal transduction histidine kinase/ligand-binding sensor domain-containing protein/ActR/RegA family two-component response regulator
MLIMAMRKKRYLFSVLLFLGLNSLGNLINAQEASIVFTNLSTRDGLSQNTIRCIIQDKDGFLWFGTFGGGLNQYDGSDFRVFQNDKANVNSLINDQVMTLCEDTSGAIFIGTVGGICLYSPEYNKFTRFLHDPDNVNSLSNNSIRKLFRDHSGNIWVGTWGSGLDRIECIKTTTGHKSETDYKFIHYNLNNDTAVINSDRISDISESPDGILWITTGNGLKRLNTKTNELTIYSNNPHDPDALISNEVSSTCVDKNGNIWVGTWGHGINILDRNNNKFIRLSNKENDKYSLSNNFVMNLYCDSSGDIWVGTWGGGLNKVLYRKKDSQSSKEFTADSIQFIAYKNDRNNTNSISGNSICSIILDRTGTMWIGTNYNGVNKFEKESQKINHIYSIPGNTSSLVSNVVLSLLVDRNNSLWIGTQDGLNVYDKKTGILSLYRNDPGNPGSLSNNYVNHIIEDSKGTIWLGTVQGLNKYDAKHNKFIRYYEDIQRPNNSNINFIHEDTKGYLWLGTYDAGLLRFDPNTGTFIKYLHDPDNPAGISDNSVLSIAEDNSSILWIGTNNGGLCEFDPGTEKFKTYLNNSKRSSSISDNTVYALSSDHLGNLWIGTKGGLNRLLRNKNGSHSFINYNVEDGLPSNTVNGIIEDRLHNIWLLTSAGMARFNPKNSLFTVYTMSDGLQENEFTPNCIFEDRKTGEIYAGGINGYNQFHPEEIESNSVPPVTKIVNLRIFNKIVNVGEKVNNRIILDKSITSTNKLVLSFKEYVIGFEYAAMHFQSPHDNHYAYKLEGFDKDWNYVDNRRLATYTSLPPGTYTFKVKAANPNRVWNNIPTSIILIIKPAWWNTVLFKIVLLMLIISVIFSVYRIRIGILKQNQRTLQNMVSKRTGELSFANAQLTETQEEISLQNEELIRHRNELENLVDERTSDLKIAKNKAEESDRLKSAFLANMSHEIRTPMNAIVGFSSLLNDEAIEAEEKEFYIKAIKNNSDTLLTIINDILDISMIEVNQFVLYKEKFCVDELLAELKSYYDIKNAKKLLFYYANENTSQKTYIYNDPIRIRQIMTNLLNNAYKFTETGFIRFGYIAEESTIKFFVEDTGIGISEANKSRVFDDFHKIEPYANKFFQGTGIGLSISKKLVGLMGGEIGVESEMGKGSLFYFTLPIAPVNKYDRIVTSDNQGILSLSKATIVVAEDEPDNFRLIERLLRKTGATIFWAKNGKEAVDYFINNSVDNECLVLMDIKMPVMNGFEACAIIKKLNKKVPIIAVTAYAQAEDRDKIMNNYFDDYISKPINPEKLWKLLYYHHARIM